MNDERLAEGEVDRERLRRELDAGPGAIEVEMPAPIEEPEKNPGG